MVRNKLSKYFERIHLCLMANMDLKTSTSNSSILNFLTLECLELKPFKSKENINYGYFIDIKEYMQTSFTKHNYV